MIWKSSIHFYCNVLNSIETIVISHNDMEIIHPLLLQCFKGLQKLDLSYNNLWKMAAENIKLFGKMLYTLQQLRNIRFAYNMLSNIPEKMFDSTPLLEEIDLSHNSLEQVHCSFKKLNKLKILNLQKNLIHILDTASITNINEISVQTSLLRNESDFPVVKIRSNSLDCSMCKSYEFFKWIEESNLFVRERGNLSCGNDEGASVIVNEQIVMSLDRCATNKLYNKGRRIVGIINDCM